MVGVVAIDVPVELSPTLTESALASCQKAIGAGRCIKSETLEPSVVPAWYAIVRSDTGEQGRLRIEFRSRTRSGELLAQRVLTFSERDPDESRWVSAGLVIAGLVAAEDASAKPAQEPPEVKPTIPVFSASRTHIAWGVDAGLLTGPGLQQGPYRLGAFGRAWIGADHSGIMGAATIRYAARGGTPSLTWWSLSAGGGARAGSERTLFTAELVGEVVVERMLASANDAETDREQTSGRSRFGGRLGASATLRLATSIRFVVGVDATALTPSVDVEVKSTNVGREPALRWAATTGFRAHF